MAKSHKSNVKPIKRNHDKTIHCLVERPFRGGFSRRLRPGFAFQPRQQEFHKQLDITSDNTDNGMENMKTKYMRPGFISGLLAILSVISLALLRLQFLTSAIGRPAGRMDPLDLHSGLAGGTAYWLPIFVHGFLLLTLVLTALCSLVSLQLSRWSEDAN